MNRRLFQNGIQMIKYRLATGEGSVAKRFNRVAIEILLLHGEILKMDYQHQLNAIQRFIMDKLVVYPQAEYCEYEIENLKKEKALKMIDTLFDICQGMKEIGKEEQIF